ncbi:MAG: PD40 domain-containing protein, partial [Armatimonadetes bacterium]|nr:PD40 domain-containing protein [Armatimonadota bacterium]
LVFQDMQNFVRMDSDGKTLEKVPLAALYGKSSGATSSDVCAPCPTNPNLLAITFHVKGTKKFEDTFHEPVSSLFLYDRAAKKRKRIVPEDMLVLDPVWSSDGKTIFFSGYRALHYLTGDPFQIYRISPDGAGLKALCKGVSPSVGPPSD